VALVGHGVYGIRSRMRTFFDLPSQSRKQALIEVGAGQTIAGTWSAVGDAWSVTWAETFDGVALDPTSVRVTAETLTRAESLSDCQATEGTYYGKQGLGTLYVHLTGDLDPNDFSVRVDTTFGFSDGSADPDHLVHPIQGAEQAPLITWTSSTNLTNYTEDLSGAGWTLNEEATIVWRKEPRSVKLNATGAASGSAQFRFNPNVIVGESYRVFGRYRTPKTAPTTQHVYVRYGTTVSLLSDGRNPATTLADGAELEATGGRWKSYCFDMIAHEADARMAFRLVNGSAAASTVYFSQPSFRRIFGWRYYPPRLAETPQVSIGATDIYPGSEEVGSGTFRFVNKDDAVLERLFSPPWFFLSRTIAALHGGRFSGGQEILYNDMEPGFNGTIAGDKPVEVSDQEAVIQAEDQRSILLASLPTRAYEVADFADMETRDEGRPRPVVFGIVFGSRPTRIDLSATTGYGIYEITDTTDWASGFLGVGPAAGGSVWAYADEDAAEKQDASRRIELDPAYDYSTDLAAGTMELHRDVRTITVTRANNKIDFDVGAGAVTATVPVGVYLIGEGTGGANDNGLLDAIETAMLAAGGVSITGAYSDTAHTVTLTRPSKGTFSLLWNTGANAHVSIGPTLGYDGQADDTTLLTYTADSVLFQGPDSHIIRTDVAGLKDDGSGTYTGTPGDVLQKAPDILQFILREILKLPASRIDSESFLAARSDFPATLGICLGGVGMEEMTVQEVIDRMENGAGADDSLADVLMDGRGMFFYRNRGDSVPVTAPHLYDKDFLSFKGYYNGQDVVGTVRVEYATNPATGQPKTAEGAVESTVLLYGRPHTRTFKTFLTEDADALAAQAQLEVLARAAIRHFEFTVSSTAMLGAMVGDIVKLTRSRALQGVGESGGLDADEFRLLRLVKDFRNHTVSGVVHTNVLS
jgi:hypothetical protein